MLHSHPSATPPSHLTHLSVCCVLQPSSPVRPRRMWELRHLGGAGGEMSNVASQKGLETNTWQFVWNENQRRTILITRRSGVWTKKQSLKHVCRYVTTGSNSEQLEWWRTGGSWRANRSSVCCCSDLNPELNILSNRLLLYITTLITLPPLQTQGHAFISFWGPGEQSGIDFRVSTEMKRMHVGAVISARCLKRFCRLDHWFNFVVKAIKTVATQNYEVLANVTQNNISIVWKCHRRAQMGEQPRL